MITTPPAASKLCETAVLFNFLGPAFLPRMMGNKYLLYVRDPLLKHESWDRFLPNYKKRSLSKRLKPHKVSQKKPYTPFPPAAEPSKVDLQLEAGEYHIGRDAKKRIAQEERMEKQKQKKEEKKREREKDFIAPDEHVDGEHKKKKRKTKAEDKD
jgi:ribosomal RNA assembly protein